MKFSVLIFSFLILISCKNNKKFKQAEFDSSISKQKVMGDTLGPNEAYKLTSPPNVFDGSFVDKASTVSYCKIYDRESRFSCFDNYQCWAFLDKSGRLLIDIGVSTPFNGSGLSIGFFDEKFSTTVYSWTDIDFGKKPEPRVQIKGQKLVLDKKQYMVGDSLYGQIYFHAIVSEFGETSEHLAEGYFRARVELQGSLKKYRVN